MKTMSKRFTMLLGEGLILLFSLIAVSQAGVETCVQPPSGLVSWWPGDGNAEDIVDGNDGVLQNGATFADGKVGQASAIPAEPSSPVITGAAALAFRKYRCENTP
jgi:hypothetical protein